MTKTNKISLLWLSAAALAVLAGCKAREPEIPPSFGDPSAEVDREFEATKVSQPLAGTKRMLKSYTKDELIKNSHLYFASRGNPFALFGQEVAFQQNIRYANILGQLPGYAMTLQPPVEPPAPELKQPEPQPYRRLSGIFFGDTVTALIEMGDGKTYLVSPGQRVGDTEWYVESINSDTLILVRNSDKSPRRVIVRLETPPFGMPTGGAPSGGNQGGGRTGGGASGKFGSGGAGGGRD